MSLQIISALRSSSQLKGSLKFTAIELAHRASSSGFVRVSHGYLASKTGLHIRTMYRHIEALEALGILVKQRMWISATRCAVNVYHLLIRPLHKCATDKVPAKLPEPGREREKFSSLREEIARQHKGMGFLTAGSDIWQACREEIARLEGLLKC